MFIDRFSAGLDEMKRKDQGDAVKVLAVLATMKRYSVFEATDNKHIAASMDYIFSKGYAKSSGGQYPWTTFEITPEGRALLSAAPSQPARQEQAMVARNQTLDDANSQSAVDTHLAIGGQS